MMHCILLSVALSVAPGTPSKASIEKNVDIDANTGGRPFYRSQGHAHNGGVIFNTQLPEARLGDWPSYYTRPGYSLSLALPEFVTIPKGYVLKFECGSAGPCDVVVFVYQCYPCKSYAGGLVRQLEDDDFVRTRCAPTFITRKGGAKQRMTGYIKTLAAGTIHQISLQEDAKYVLTGLSHGKGTYCPHLPMEATCNLETHGLCLFSKAHGECKYATCIQQGPGGCDKNTCADKEVDLALP